MSDFVLVNDFNNKDQRARFSFKAGGQRVESPVLPT